MKLPERNTDTCNTGTHQDNVSGTSKALKVKKQRLVKKKYEKDYILYGFSWCGNESASKPLCVICRKRLVNEAMVRNKLTRHLNAKHAVHASNNKDHFQRFLSQNQKQECFMKSFLQFSKKNQKQVIVLRN